MFFRNPKAKKIWNPTPKASEDVTLVGSPIFLASNGLMTQDQLDQKVAVAQQALVPKPDLTNPIVVKKLEDIKQEIVDFYFSKYSQ